MTSRLVLYISVAGTGAGSETVFAAPSLKRVWMVMYPSSGLTWPNGRTRHALSVGG